MKTKPIDYTGCHPAIKEQLKKGNAVWCRCWLDTFDKQTDEYSKEWIIGYNTTEDIQTYITTEDKSVMYAEPIETKRVLKDPIALMKAMVEHNWEWDDRDYYWWKRVDSHKYSFENWNDCGTEQRGFPDYFYQEIEG